MSNDFSEEILRNISRGGSVETKVKDIIGGNLSHILNLSSGAARLQTNVIERFKLIISQPKLLAHLNPFEIRCSLCKRIISYPCWYYEVKYAVNVFHYFICFDRLMPDKPNCKCYRRS